MGPAKCLFDPCEAIRVGEGMKGVINYCTCTCSVVPYVEADPKKKKLYPLKSTAVATVAPESSKDAEEECRPAICLVDPCSTLRLDAGMKCIANYCDCTAKGVPYVE